MERDVWKVCEAQGLPFWLPLMPRVREIQLSNARLGFKQGDGVKNRNAVDPHQSDSGSDRGR